MTKTQVTAYELIDHGIDYPDYFQGCGVAFTDFTDVATGCGDNPAEAIEDALESLAQAGQWDIEDLESRIKAEEFSGKPYPVKPSASKRGEDAYYYASIRVR